MIFESKNIYGAKLAPCSLSPKTGFFRDGCCNTSHDDQGMHTVCIEVTAEFLEFSKSKGNDLSTANPAFGFPGLKPGDRWCLCAARWLEAYKANKAPDVVLESTHEETLAMIPRNLLEKHKAED